MIDLQMTKINKIFFMYLKCTKIGVKVGKISLTLVLKQNLEESLLHKKEQSAFVGMYQAMMKI